MNRQERQFLRVTLIVAIFFVTCIACVSYLHYYQHPRYYELKSGMTKSEVENIVGAGHDDYPDGDRTISYFFSSEGIIIVHFDASNRLISKKLKKD